MSFLRVILL
ncbi:uncharacterized protein FTOL_13669 [Fusarium torulosum]|uniref:Uncharacterized protein n=1 Tax=Fusarium torulosum TaxID=33205 RepID=A0AAE8MMY6_9HYPO|nr:uncharacterized protein FTOL_13669 [Fusarium torulosum]